MKLKTIAFIAVLTAISLTSCKNSPATENSVVESSIEEKSIIAETIKPEESSTISETSIEEISEDDFWGINKTTSSAESVIENESSLIMEIPEYEYVNGEIRDGIEITKYNGTDTEVIIPKQIDGVEVTSIGDNAFDGNEKITSVTIPNTVLDVGIEAFANCKNLSNVIFEENSKLDRILVRAFDDTALQEFTVPESCHLLGNAFNRCNIKKFVILGTKTEINYMSGFSLPLDVVVYFPRGSQADGDISLHTPYTYKYLDELE